MLARLRVVEDGRRLRGDKRGWLYIGMQAGDDVRGRRNTSQLPPWPSSEVRVRCLSLCTQFVSSSVLLQTCGNFLFRSNTQCGLRRPPGVYLPDTVLHNPIYSRTSPRGQLTVKVTSYPSDASPPSHLLLIALFFGVRFSVHREIERRIIR